MKKGTEWVLDYETTGFEAYNDDKIFAYVLTNDEVECQIGRLDWTDKIKSEEALEKLKEFHLDKSITKIAHNAKFEMGFTTTLFNGILPSSDWHDTILMSSMLNNLSPTHKLEYLANRYFEKDFPSDTRRWALYDKAVKKHMTKQNRLIKDSVRWKNEILGPLENSGISPLVYDRPNYGLIPLDVMNGYQKADGERGMMIYHYFHDELFSNEKLRKCYKMEIDTLFVAQKMEQRGMMVHTKNAEDLLNFLSEELSEIQKQKLKLFKKDVNLDSAPQLQKELFSGAFSFDPISYTATGKPSASKDSLLDLQKKYKHEVFDMILKYRAYAKSQTMIRTYISLSKQTKNIIYPSMHTDAARTGRQSVSNPNLQNVSKEVSTNTVYGVPARKCFRPRPGFVFFLGDYSGIEMRLIIDASNESRLIEEFQKNEDFDCHSFNSIAILGEKYFNSLEGKERKLVRADIKNATFGISYGANLPTFAKAIRKSVSETVPLLNNYRKICPGICGFTRNMMNQVRSKGYIVTAFGRTLHVERDKGYTASNYMIQGTAAQILKRAQIQVDNYCDEIWGNDKLRMILTVHDEIIIEMHRELLSKQNEILHDLSWCMTNMPEIKVPLTAEWNIATSDWQSKSEVLI